MKKILLAMLCLFIWINSQAQVTALSNPINDTTLTVNTTGINPFELIFYPPPFCEEWSLTDKVIYSFIGDGEKWIIKTSNNTFDTYLYLYEKQSALSYLPLTCNDDNFNFIEVDELLGLSSEMHWMTEVGKEYHIVLGGYPIEEFEEFGGDESGFTDLSLSRVEYCTSKGTRNNFEWIKQTMIGNDINEVSGKDNPAYTDHSDILLEVDTGEVIAVHLTPGYKRRVYREYWRIWIDWNYDGDFIDPGEKVFEQNGKNTQSGSFVTPINVDTNILKMRVSMRWRKYPSSCGNYANGEVEDYTIKVNGAQGIFGEDFFGPPPEDIVFAKSEDMTNNNSGNGYEFTEVYPNPIIENNKVYGYIRVEEIGIKHIQILNILGQTVLQTTLNCNEEETHFEISTEGLQRGVYFITLGHQKESVKIVIQ